MAKGMLYLLLINTTTSKPNERIGAPGTAFYPGIDHPDNIPAIKHAFSGVLKGNILQVLKEYGIDLVIAGGLTTPICVMGTV